LALIATQTHETLGELRNLGGPHAGYYTPSLLMGADFIRTLPGVTFAWV
jgi:short subunit dehydrogenase-like uncharacterized protein